MKNLTARFFGTLLMVFATGCFGTGQNTNGDATVKCHNYMCEICWDAPVPVETNIMPTTGTYSVVPDTAVDDVSPLDTDGFTVIVHSRVTGELDVHLSTDAYRYDDITVQGGAFAYTHGGGMDQTICPTDGYVISGSFVAPTIAQGWFKYYPGGGSDGGNFTATLVP